MVKPREKKEEKKLSLRWFLKDWRKKFLAIFLVLLMVFSAFVILFR
jgi:hypothetical protein